MTDYYNKNANILATQYQSLSVASVHGDWISILQKKLPMIPLKVMDVGAGSGRDAAFFAKERTGNSVLAVEPAKELAEFGKEFTKGLNVRWSHSALPDLAGIEDEFHLILLSAVWMHLAPKDRLSALARLAELLGNNGLLVISLRLTISEDDQNNRQMFSVSLAELIELSAQVGLICHLDLGLEIDRLGRDISWQTVLLSHACTPTTKSEDI